MEVQSCIAAIGYMPDMNVLVCFCYYCFAANEEKQGAWTYYEPCD